MSETETADPAARTAATTFHAELPADRLSTALDPVGALVSECRVRFDEEGVRIAATDPATVALVDLRIGVEAFETYCAEDGRVGLDLERLQSVLGVADRGDAVELALDPETRRLEVAIGGLSYSLALLDPETVRAPPDRAEMEYELPGGAAVPEGLLDRGIGAAEMVGDHVAIGVDGDDPALFVHAEGDTDEASLRVPAADLDRFEAADARSLYSLDYLRSMGRAIPSGASVDLGVGSDAPLSLSFAPEDGVSVDYLLAPRRKVD